MRLVCWAFRTSEFINFPMTTANELEDESGRDDALPTYGSIAFQHENIGANSESEGQAITSTALFCAIAGH